MTEHIDADQPRRWQTDVPPVVNVQKGDGCYPASLVRLLGEQAPAVVPAWGNLDILEQKRIALFCSVQCPGERIIQAYDLARHLRDTGKTVISGFHSPMEKECLTLLLRGEQPIIICPARGLEKMRLPADWKTAMVAGRLLLLSPFSGKARRVTADLAKQRNLFVAAMADEACFVHTAPGGNLEQLKARVKEWGIPLMNI
ncbi:MAG TPA: DNA-processing protein DprA [Sedimentisphaerales bacterium]|nr:DNA-processing protein DprA [Sedimentisphaerales bacterium]HRS12583.1 DNA-processing protein DprA [Sedimentisphaerales bacterium]HRV49221.1 DNA-processing protein DprA [Sedimentisphaerales bacterium]